MFGEGTRGGHSDADWRRATQARQRYRETSSGVTPRKTGIRPKKRDTSKNSKKRLRFTHIYMYAE